MLLGSIHSISWNSLYGDEEENQTSNDTNLGVPDDIPLLGFLAAWSDAQNKQPDNWRYASSLSIPPPAFSGFSPAQLKLQILRLSRAHRWLDDQRHPGSQLHSSATIFRSTKQTKKKLQLYSCPASTYFPHCHLPALHVCCVIERD